MLKIPKPSAVIFDWDNTLVDTFPLIVKAHSHARTSFGLSAFDLETASRYVNKSARDIYPEWFGENSSTAIDILYQYIQERHIEDLRTLNGAQALLKHLSERGIPLAIVSNKRGDILRKELDHLGWQSYFRVSYGSGDADKDKPDPTPAFKSLEDMGIKADKYVWYIGDSESDFKVANAAGLSAIYVKNRPMMSQKTLSKYDIDGFFNTTEELSKRALDYLDLASI